MQRAQTANLFANFMRAGLTFIPRLRPTAGISENTSPP